jgi:hypothetical protein
MLKQAAALLLLAPALAFAGVLNVEFKFTPYIGDLKNDEVQTVPGKARVFLNNVLVADQDVAKQNVPVIFDEREIAPSVWVPADSMGPALRKGKNTIRIEFEPSDPKTPYHGQFSWASVTDQTTEVQSGPGSTKSTNQTGEGKEDKPATGKLVVEREFVANFATDRPWHHYPAITALDDADKQKLAALIGARTAEFKPDFAGVYRTLGSREGIQVDEIKKVKCLDAAYAAGIRITPPKPDQLVFTTTGNPEVMVEGKNGALYDFGNPALFAKIKGDEAQMCAGVVLSMVYPPHLVFVRTPSGAWEAVY